jgi:hypothetical protein
MSERCVWVVENAASHLPVTFYVFSSEENAKGWMGESNHIEPQHCAVKYVPAEEK